VALTYGDARQLLSQWAGRGGICPTAERTKLFVREVMEYMLISGSYGAIRKFTFQAQRGMFTIPYELEAIEKVKIDNVVGSVWDKWFEFHSTRDMCSCVPAGEALFEDANYWATAYDVPASGTKVGVIGTCQEAEGTSIVIQGEDPTGRVIYTYDNGKQIVGERLTIRKGVLTYSEVTFGKITGVLKDITTGYVQLYAVNTTNNAKVFLSDYSPLEEKPSYRRYKLTASNCAPICKVEVLGKVRLKQAYTDNDFIPFDTLYTLSLAAQAVNANYNGDSQTAKAKDDTMMEMINRENTHKRVQNGQPVEVWYPTSPGSIRNIVS